MHECKDDKEFQARLLANHPAYRANGVDPLWRWIAAMGWITVAILVATIAARGEEGRRGGERRGEWRDNFCAVPVLVDSRKTSELLEHPAKAEVSNDGEAREAHRNWIQPGMPKLIRRTLAAAQFISGSRAAEAKGSLGSKSSSGQTKQQRTTPEPAGPGLLKVAGETLKVTGSRVANIAPNLQPATSHLHPSARTSLITERFLDALEDVESGRDARAVGDHGRSLGSFQFKEVAWAQVNTLRDAQGLGRHSYRFGAHNRVTARIYARSYLGWLESYLTRALHRSPSHQELYAVWNLGPAGFRARGFDLARCPEHVRKAAGRMEPAKHANNAKGGGK